MIFGIGTDICDVRRIASTLQRHGDRFAERILSPTERTIWEHRRQRWPERGDRFVATRFSAKEAFSKAVHLGIRSPMQWRLCEITNASSGAPQIVLHGPLKEWFDRQSLTAHITLSDESDYAVSFCVVERMDDSGGLRD